MAWDIEKFSPDDVLALCGMDTSNQKSDQARFRCPFCGSKTSNGNMSIKRSYGVVHCFACDYRGNVIQLYQDIFGLNSYKGAYKQILSDLNLTSLSDDQMIDRAARIREKINSYKVNTIERANIDEINAAYSNLLSSLKLNEEHHLELLGRGMDEEMIIRNQYKSSITSYNEASRISRLLLKQGLNLKGVPGFYTDYNRDWSFVRFFPGFYVPYRNVNNKIFGTQIRLDDEFIEMNADKDLKRHYWISSSKKDNGCSAENQVHYACDFGWDKRINAYLPIAIDIEGRKAFGLTEGALKADTFFSLSGFPTIAVAGVHCYEGLRKAIRELKALGVEVIYNFYDMDSESNENVAKALCIVNDIIVSIGLKFVRPTWNPKLKGIDDYYAYKLKGIIPKGMTESVLL